MINAGELAICKRRGHSDRAHEGWTQCKWCGTWLREIRTVEERADDPPADELDIRTKVSHDLNQLKPDKHEKRPPS
jgi:hypothetical protein